MIYTIRLFGKCCMKNILFHDLLHEEQQILDHVGWSIGEEEALTDITVDRDVSVSSKNTRY